MIKNIIFNKFGNKIIYSIFAYSISYFSCTINRFLIISNTVTWVTAAEEILPHIYTQFKNVIMLYWQYSFYTYSLMYFSVQLLEPLLFDKRYDYVGCFLDQESRALGGFATDVGDSSSPEKCITLCTQKGYVYAGVQSRWVL